MIPIYESIMAISVKAGTGMSLIKIIEKDTFTDFLKSLYGNIIDNKYDVSMDVSTAINNVCDSAFAVPVLCDLYKDGKKLNGCFIKINNEYYDLLSHQYYNDVQCVRKTEIGNESVSDKFWDLANYLECEYDNYLLNISELLGD